MRHPCSIWVLSLAAGTSAFIADAHAQGGEAEIVVTARLRAEAAQDVPATISVFSAADIEDAGIDGIGDPLQLIPNVSIVNTQNAGTSFINIRGIGQARNSEPPVAFVIDGVQTISPNQITQDLYDIERIEVLKGPQGALYGRNAIGGAINITTRAPGNDFEGSAAATFRNGFDYKLRFGVSGAIVPNELFFRLAGSFQEDNGVIRNATLGRDVDFRDDRNLRARLLWTPTDKFSLDLRASHGELEAGAQYYVATPGRLPNDFETPVNADEYGFGTRDLDEYSLKADYDLGFAKLSSTTAYASVDEVFFGDVDYSPLSILRVVQALDVTALSQEVRLTSPSDQRFRWLAGAYYLDTERDLDTRVEINLGAGFFPGAPALESNENQAWAVFGQINYDLTEALELTLGLRYDEDKREQTNRVDGTVRAASFDHMQPKVSVRYDWSPDFMTYVTYAEGFRSGGFNAPSSIFEPVYAAEIGTSYEVGFKSEWFDDRLIVNAAAFHITSEDQQYFFLALDPLTSTLVQGLVNINEVESVGYELDVQARPVKGLVLRAGIGLIDSEMTDFNGTGQFDGNPLPLTYGYTYQLGAQYTLPLSEALELVGRLDYTIRGDNVWYLDAVDRQKPFDILDARLTLQSQRWAVTAFAENAFDEKYNVEFAPIALSGLPFDIKWPGEPARYGVELRYTF